MALSSDHAVAYALVNLGAVLENHNHLSSTV
jgi:hypothetical protein